MYTNAQAALMAAVQVPRDAYTPTIESLSNTFLTWLNAQDIPQAAQPLAGGQPWDWHTAQVTLDNTAKITAGQRHMFSRLVQAGRLAQAEKFFNDIMLIEQGYDVDEMRTYMNTHPHVRHDTMQAFMHAIVEQDYESAHRLYKLAQDTEPTDV
jgi:hypothetical protein